MYVYMYMYMYIYMYVYVYMYVCLYVYIDVCMYVCMYCTYKMAVYCFTVPRLTMEEPRYKRPTKSEQTSCTWCALS